MNQTETNPRYSENALREKAFLSELNKKPPLQKFFGYCKLSGPGFMNAAFTLGAGSFASSVTLGTAYGYDMLWIPLYSFALGLFMLLCPHALSLPLKYLLSSSGQVPRQVFRKSGHRLNRLLHRLHRIQLWTVRPGRGRRDRPVLRCKYQRSQKHQLDSSGSCLRSLISDVWIRR